MSLPTLSLPTFELILPSTKKKLLLRPYTVKEQTLILMASNSDDVEEITTIIKQILSACILTPNFKLDDLTIFDLQFIFLRLRAKSVGEVVSLSYKCQNIPDVNVKPCGQVNSFDVNLLTIEVAFPEKSNREIHLNSNLGIKLKYPSLNSAKILEKWGMINSYDSLIDALSNDIEYVFDSEKIYDDFTKTELAEFVSNFGVNEANKLYDFYANQPTLQYTLKFKCKKCGYEEDILLEGMASFLE